MSGGSCSVGVNDVIRSDILEFVVGVCGAPFEVEMRVNLLGVNG